MDFCSAARLLRRRRAVVGHAGKTGITTSFLLLFGAMPKSRSVNPTMSRCLQTCLLVATAWAATACKGDKPAMNAVGKATTVALPQPADASTVCVFVGDVKAQCVDAAAVKQWPRLDNLLPPEARRMGTWKTIVVQTTTGRGTDLNQPADTYPDLVPALFPAADGTTTLGMFDLVELANHGRPKWQQPAIKEVHVIAVLGGGRGENEDGHAAADPKDLAIKFIVAGQESTLAGPALLAIAREAQPGEDGEAKGWSLFTLLKSAKVPLPTDKPGKRYLLTDAAGMNLTLEPSDFAAGVSIPFVKLNKQGALRFWVFKKKGEGWAKGADLRGLASVQVLN